MSYGVNLPWGLQATKTLGSATYNSQSSPYLIAPGYVNNIFKGDPVAINAAGYLINAYDIPVGAFGVSPVIGVFVGCSFITPTALNPIDPASPGRSYWPAGTNTLNSVPATAFVIDDPNVIYNVQTNATPGLTQANIGNTAAFAFTVDTGIVQGNTNTGVSSVALDQSTVGTLATRNMKILRFVPISGNFASDAVTPALGYNNVEVIIQNHFFCSRPAGI